MPIVTLKPNEPPRATRIRGSLHQKIRAQYLALRGPMCRPCKAEGVLRPWVHLDHIVDLDHGGVESRDPLVNRQGLCIEHHRMKTNADFGQKPTGGDSDGMPTDPLHPWNRNPKIEG